MLARHRPNNSRPSIRRFRAPLIGVIALCAVGGAATASSPGTSGAMGAPGLAGVHGLVVAAEPDAAEAGLKVLKAGGTAIDAAVAVQAVLGLEEPQSTSLTGGAFLVYYEAKTHRTTVYNGREKAPATATPQLFFDDSGHEMPKLAAIMSGRSTGAPGAVPMLARAHAEHGVRPWKSLWADAERLARDGFVVPGRMGAAMNSNYPMANTPAAQAYFAGPDGKRHVAGDTMRNPAYARTVSLIAAQGPKGLMRGETAAAILASVAAGPVSGALSQADLDAYVPQVMAPVCMPYHGYRICSAPPPASGVGVLEVLNILSHTDIDRRGPKDPEAWYQFAQASRLMYADRDHYEGDPDFVTTPVEGLLDPAYGAERAALIPSTGAAAPLPGKPRGAPAPGPDGTREPGGTTHFVVVDRHGNVVSMTTTVESIFGSGRMAAGMFLNNQLTDFSGPTGIDGRPAANAPGPGKRPRSSMSPVIVFDGSGRPVAAFGSPGGNSIVAYVAKVAVGWIDWKLSLQEAVNLPNVVARGGVVSVEKGMDPAVVTALRAHGLEVRADAGETSGLNGFAVRNGVLETAQDPRREAVARKY
jgi:gamma-glutamyltranspeptidase / glutathione hydrolase